MFRLTPALRVPSAAALLLVLLLIAGGASTAPRAMPAPPLTGDAAVHATPPEPDLVAGASAPVTLESLVQAALADAARLSGLPRASLQVLDAAAVDWPDGAAGCPEPGVEYTQALVPGFRIRIRAGKQVLSYHATRFSRVPQLCPAERVQPALPPRGGVV